MRLLISKRHHRRPYCARKKRTGARKALPMSRGNIAQYNRWHGECKKRVVSVTAFRDRAVVAPRSQTPFGNAIRETLFRIALAGVGSYMRNRVSRTSVPKQSLGTRTTRTAVFAYASGSEMYVCDGELDRSSRGFLDKSDRLRLNAEGCQRMKNALPIDLAAQKKTAGQSEGDWSLPVELAQHGLAGSRQLARRLLHNLRGDCILLCRLQDDGRQCGEVGSIASAAVHGGDQVLRLIQTPSVQEAFGQARRGAAAVGGADDRLQAGHDQGVGAALIAEQVAPSPSSRSSAVRALPERDRTRTGDEREAPTLRRPRGQEDRGIVGDFDAIRQPDALGPLADHAPIVRPIRPSESQASGHYRASRHPRRGEGRAHRFIQRRQRPLLAHCLPIGWTRRTATEDRRIAARQQGHGMRTAAVDAEIQFLASPQRLVFSGR